MSDDRSFIDQTYTFWWTGCSNTELASLFTNLICFLFISYLLYMNICQMTLFRINDHLTSLKFPVKTTAKSTMYICLIITKTYPCNIL